MTRNVQLISSAIQGMALTAEAWKKAGVLSPDEYSALHKAFWSIVVAAEKQRDVEAELKELAARTAEAL
jgi:hypothetical protein